MATPVLACGFECQTTAHIGQTNGTPTIDTTLFEPGGGGASVHCTAAQNVVIPATIVSSATILVLRVYIYITTAPTSNCDLLHFYVPAGSEPRISYRLATDDYASSFDGTTFGTGRAISTGAWHYIDIRVVQAATKTIDWALDGTTVGTQRTLVETASTFNGVGLPWAAAPTVGVVNVDHVWLSKTSADYPLGAGYVQGFSPTSDGTHTSTSTNIVKGTTATPVGAAITSSTTDAWQWVDDVPMDATTDFWNQQTVATEYAEVNFNDVSVAPRSVEAIVSTSAAATQAETSKAVLFDGTTASDIYALATAGVAWTNLKWNRKHYDLTPTGGAWDTTKFNAARVRWGYSTDATPDIYCNSIMLEAEFAPVAAAAGNPRPIRFVNQAVQRSAVR